MNERHDASQLLRDDLTGDWVIIAPHRQKRPDGFAHTQTHDPFSPNHLSPESVLATYGRGVNRMTVISNAFPIFQSHRGVTGRQEIIVEGDKAVPFSSVQTARIEALLGAFVERFRVLQKDPVIKYIQGFKNEGATAGASQPHPHSQIFATSFVPQRLLDEAKRRRSALKRLGMSAHAHALSLATPERVIFEDRHVIAFANPTARFSYEVRIVTRTRRDNITRTTPSERVSLAKAIHALLPLIKKRTFGFNLFFHDVLNQSDEHFEIRFAPRANTWGGFELDAGVVVNPVPAETAAAEYLAAQ